MPRSRAWHGKRDIPSRGGGSHGKSALHRRTHDLPQLFGFFGLEARPDVVDAHVTTIPARLQAELGAIERCCGGLREKERFRVIRAELQLAYQSAARRGEAG